MNLCFIFSLVSFCLSSFLYIKDQFIPLNSFGILGFKYGVKNFDDGLEQKLSLILPENEFKYLYYNEDEFKERKTRILAFTNLFNNGLIFYGKYSSSPGTVNVTCFVEWYGDFDRDCINKLTGINFKAEKASLENYSFNLDSSSRVISNFILAYKCLHFCSTTDSALYYFNIIKHDTILLKKVQLSPAESYMRKFYADIEAFIKLANVINTKSSDSVVQIGKKIKGGVVFYIEPNGKHGLICADEDLISHIAWRQRPTMQIVNSFDTVNGANNTEKIINEQEDIHEYAAKICREYNGGGYSDWFLPSKQQLKDLYTNKKIVGNMKTMKYWTSTGNGDNVWYIDFGDSGKSWVASPDSQLAVRAIRAF